MYSVLCIVHECVFVIVFAQFANISLQIVLEWTTFDHINGISNRILTLRSIFPGGRGDGTDNNV